MRRLSSRLMFLTKRIFPAIWFGFLGLFLVGVLWGMIAGGNSREDFLFALFAVFIMAAGGYFVFKKLVFDLAEEVEDAGTELVVKNKGQIERIALRDVSNVSYVVLTSPQHVTLTLRQPALLGKEITFMPPLRFVPFDRSPIIDDLFERIDAARKR